VRPDEAIAWLDAHVNLEHGFGTPAGGRPRPPSLERMRSLVALLGSPQLDQPTIHLTGTNGKTTVARMLAALLTEAGLRVGVTTSPHLERVHERICLGDTPIGDDDLAAVLTEVAAAEAHLPEPASYFEILIAAAFAWFSDRAVDVAVVEVGVGGTWDATNVVDAPVAVVTNVSLDHTEILGPTRAAIAADKAGIVKPGARLVLGETDPELAPLFTARAGRSWLRGRDFDVVASAPAHGGRVVGLRTPGGSYPEVFVPVHGAHQAANAAVALTAAEAFCGRALPPEVVAAGFGQVTSPGRVEVAGRAPLVILDGAHNPAGAAALAATLAEEFPPAARHLVVGMLREKDPAEFLAALGAEGAGHLHCCPAPSPRALDPAAIARAAAGLGIPREAVRVHADVAGALGAALAAAGPDEQVVVTGSLYVVGAARAALRLESSARRPPR
jgi:dihydrofolate synthase/folylpolyglutamate synthase